MKIHPKDIDLPSATMHAANNVKITFLYSPCEQQQPQELPCFYVQAAVRMRHLHVGGHANLMEAALMVDFLLVLGVQKSGRNHLSTRIRMNKDSSFYLVCRCDPDSLFHIASSLPGTSNCIPGIIPLGVGTRLSRFKSERCRCQTKRRVGLSSF